MTIPFLFSTAAIDAAGRDLNPAFACQTTDRSLRQSDETPVSGCFEHDKSANSGFLVRRLNRNGKLDSTFGTASEVRLSFGHLNRGAHSGLLQADTKIVVVGFNTTPTRKGVDFAFARYHRN